MPPGDNSLANAQELSPAPLPLGHILYDDNPLKFLQCSAQLHLKYMTQKAIVLRKVIL